MRRSGLSRWVPSAFALALAAACTRAAPPRSTGAAKDAPPVEAAAAECRRCHLRQAAQWRSSRHARAVDNPVFWASWTHFPDGWCLSCHAPDPRAQVELLGARAVPGARRPPRAPPPAGRWKDGVACVACHVRDGAVLTTRLNPAAGAERAHRLKHAPELTTQACGQCHQFNFQRHTPRWPFSQAQTPAQDTVHEWSTSRAASQGRSCASCHMPGGAHTFPGAHDPALVRDALQVDVQAAPGGAVAVVVRAVDAAHRIPTGDPFRRLVFELCASPECTPAVARFALRRTFEATDDSWRLYSDTTVPPTARDGGGGARGFILHPKEPPRSWRLRYLYGDRRFEDDLPPEEVGFTVFQQPFGG